MAQYSLVLRKSVHKDLKRLPKKDVQRIVRAIRSLADDPHPPQSKRLSGDEKYRLRSGVYRILYEIDGEELVVCIVRVRHRRQAYRK